MNIREYLIACLVEELSEVQKELVKCLRFTPNHVSAHDNTSNIDRVSMEYADVIAVLELLAAEGVVLKADPERVADKRRRTIELMPHSQKLGALQ